MADYGLNQRWTLLAAASASYPPYTANIFNTATGNPLLGVTAWTIVTLDDDYFLFVNASTGEVLDDPDFSISTGASAVPAQRRPEPAMAIDDAGNVDGVEAGNVICNAYSTLLLDARLRSSRTGSTPQA